MKRSMFRWMGPTAVLSIMAAAGYFVSNTVAAKVVGQPPSADAIAASELGAQGELFEVELDEDGTLDGSMEDLDVPDVPDVPTVEFVEDSIVDGAEDAGGGAADNLRVNIIDRALSRSQDEEQRFIKKTKLLVEQIRTAKGKKDNGKADELRAELSSIVSEHFQWLEGNRQKQIESLEQRLAKLKSVVESRAQNAEKIVERRVKSLLQESDDLDWNPGNAGQETWEAISDRVGMFERRLPSLRANLDGRLSPLSEQKERYEQLLLNKAKRLPARERSDIARPEMERLDSLKQELRELNAAEAKNQAALKNFTEDKLQRLHAEQKVIEAKKLYDQRAQESKMAEDALQQVRKLEDELTHRKQELDKLREDLKSKPRKR